MWPHGFRSCCDGLTKIEASNAIHIGIFPPFETQYPAEVQKGAVMANYAETAKGVLEAIGGAGNVTFATHCVTRLRFNLADKAKVDFDALKEVPGVLGNQFSGDQFQVIIGPTVAQVYDEVCRQGGISQQAAVDENLDAPVEKLTLKNLPGRILDALTGCLTPVIPLLVGGGLLMLFPTILGPSGLNLCTTDSDLYRLFALAGNAVFYFIPMAIAYTGSKKFGATTVLAIGLVGIMMHPDFNAIVAEGKPFTVYGIPMTLTTYGSSVFPVILIMWAQAKVEKVLNRIIPDTFHLLGVPLLTFLIMMPIALCGLGPIGTILGTGIEDLIMWLNATVGPLSIAVMGALFTPLIATGMHLPVLMVGLANLTANGYENVIYAGGAAMTLASIAAGWGYMLKAKTKQDRELGFSCGFTQTVIGVGEPTIFGILMPHPRMMLYVMAGSFAGGLYAGITGVAIYAPLVSNIFGLVCYMGGPSMANFVNACISGAIAFAVTMALTLIFGPEGKKKTVPGVQAA